MSFEYLAVVTPAMPPGILARLSGRLSSTGKYAFLNSTSSEIAFRYTSAAVRENWPEDFSVSFDGTEIILAVHSGNRAQRTELISDLERILGEECGSLHFEEI